MASWADTYYIARINLLFCAYYKNASGQWQLAVLPLDQASAYNRFRPEVIRQNYQNYQINSKFEGQGKDKCGQLNCHKYFQTITRRSQPVWLNEGISIYLSGQLTNYKKVGKLSNFLLFESTNFIDGKDVYQESGFVVEKLVTKFGKEKLLDLLKSIRKTSDNSQFPKVFNKIYGFELNYDNINNL